MEMAFYREAVKHLKVQRGTSIAAIRLVSPCFGRSMPLACWREFVDFGCLCDSVIGIIDVQV